MIKEKVISQMFIASSQHFVNQVTDELIEQFTHDFEKHLAETGAEKVKPQNFFTVFHVDEYRDKNYCMELWVQIEALKESTDNIQFKSIPESEVAYTLVSENYVNLKFAYDSLFHYVRKHGYIVSDYPRETYFFDAGAPYGYLTEIQLPFARQP